MTLICLVSELKVFLKEIIGKDACAILIVTMKSLFNFLCRNHHCTLSSYLVFAGAPQSSFLSTTLFSRYFWSSLALFLFLFFGFLPQFSSLPFFRLLLVLFSSSSLIYTNLNLTLRKRATSPWILQVSKNSRTTDLVQKHSQNNGSLHNYMILTKLNNFLKVHYRKVTALKVNDNYISILTMTNTRLKVSHLRNNICYNWKVDNVKVVIIYNHTTKGII